MNTEIAESIANAFLEHREAFGVEMIIHGATITAVVNDSALGRDLVSGGIADEGELEAKALADDLPEGTAQIGWAVEFKGRNFRVSHVGHQPGSDIVELRLRPVRGK